MARRKVAYKGASPKRIKYQNQEALAKDFLRFQVDKPHFSVEVENFESFFYAQVANQMVGLAKGAVTAAKKQLLGAETPWGQARLRGEYFGVPFAPYGKGPGRFETGNMYNALKVLGTNTPNFVGSRGSSPLNVDFGYDRKMDRSPRTGRPYFLDQERGFLNRRSFDSNETWSTGIASFTEARRPRRVKGAFALEAGAKSISNRMDSRFAFAWNKAKKLFEEGGFSADKVGSYIDARNAYRRNPPKRIDFSRGSLDASPEELSSASETTQRFKLYS